MSRPPRDEWDDVLSQVEEALDRLRLGDGPHREALLDGVREALQALGADANADADADGPRVEVVEGGRADDAPRRPPEPSGERSRPPLRVADDERAPDDTERAAVKLVRLGAGRRATDVWLESEGSIRLDPSPGQTGWQTVYQGETARAYRVACHTGVMRVTADGASASLLSAGQTIDVEARVVRVGADQPAAGRYARLRA